MPANWLLRAAVGMMGFAHCCPVRNYDTLPIPTATYDLSVFLAANLVLPIPTVLVFLAVGGGAGAVGGAVRREPLEFNTFPSLLLVTTLIRLGLNVATTRAILLNADAGSIIETFGRFVVGGNFVVGIVVFAILLVIQLLVVTKGAGSYFRSRGAVYLGRDAG